MILTRGLMLVLDGTMIGVVAAFVLTRYLTDAVKNRECPLLLAVVALIACYIPERRAMPIDPVVALLYE